MQQLEAWARGLLPIKVVWCLSSLKFTELFWHKIQQKIFYMIHLYDFLIRTEFQSILSQNQPLHRHLFAENKSFFLNNKYSINNSNTQRVAGNPLRAGMCSECGKRDMESYAISGIWNNEPLVLQERPLEHSHMFLVFIELWQTDRGKWTKESVCGVGVIPLKLIRTDSKESLSQHNQK